MRKGRLVREHVVDRLRRSLQDAGWHGQNERGYWRQEDASELLLFLTEAFDLPYLPVRKIPATPFSVHHSSNLAFNVSFRCDCSTAQKKMWTTTSS